MRKVGKLEGWKVEKLGDVIQKTETINPLQTPNKEFIYIDVSSVNNKTLSIEETSLIKGKNAPSRARKRIKAGDVIFATVRPTLKRIAVIPDEYDHQVCSTGYFVLRGKEFINNKYLFYYLQSDSFNERMEKLQKGASYPAVTDTEVKEQIISYPPLPEQQRIVSVLDEAFASIAQAKSNAERNLINARELFETALAKMYENAGEHWEEKNLGDIASEMQTGPFGSTLHKSDYVANGIPVINPQNLVDGKIIPLQKMMVNQKTKERLSRYILQEKDIVLARRGEMGRCAIVEKEQAGWLCGSGSFIVRVKKEVDANYLVRYLSSAKVKRILQKGSVGTTMDNLNQGILSQVPVPFPPLAEQRAIVGRLEALSAETGRLEEIYQSKVEGLEELKKSVLGKAFEGEL